MAAYEDNLSAVLDEWDEMTPSRSVYLLELSNDTEYARYLNDRLGYWVMSDKIALDAVQARLEALVDSGKPLSTANINEALWDAAGDILDAYTDVIGSKNTGGKEMPPPRPKHRGAWADDTLQLATSFVRSIPGHKREVYPYASDL